MTVWGLISDVHGRLPALERAIDRCRARGAERFAFLGDLLGRGDSEGCVELIRALADVSVVGTRSLDWRERVGATAREYVLGLPVAGRAEDFLAVHGAARLDRDINTDDARRGFGRTYRRLVGEDARVGFLGHSHYARAWRLADVGRPPELLYDALVDPEGATIRLSPADSRTRYVVNVGTTGLPFPGKGPPSCAVYDSGARTVEIVPLAAPAVARGEALSGRRGRNLGSCSAERSRS
jgi:calcineurin-like phosphoesterase family protein